MFYVTFFQAEPPIFDAVPQDRSDCTSVRVPVDGRAADGLASLLALGSFEVAHTLAAVYAAGVSAGQRDARARPVPPSPA